MVLKKAAAKATRMVAWMVVSMESHLVVAWVYQLVGLRVDNLVVLMGFRWAVEKDCWTVAVSDL